MIVGAITAHSGGETAKQSVVGGNFYSIRSVFITSNALLVTVGEQHDVPYAFAKGLTANSLLVLMLFQGQGRNQGRGEGHSLPSLGPQVPSTASSFVFLS